MDDKPSTFDQLVETLSSNETQEMLQNIIDNMQSVTTDITEQENNANTKSLSATTITKYEEESFLFKLWVNILAFLKSTSVEAFYGDQLIKRLGKNIHRNYKKYINVRRNLFTGSFYNALKELRKTQMFFSALLSAYDTDKGGFYLLLSSFISTDVYNKLMYITDFTGLPPGTEFSANLKTKLLREIDESIANLSENDKASMYQCAQAIEWMKNFCIIPIDKMLLRFVVISPEDTTCPIVLLKKELVQLTNVLTTIKPIPNELLKTLFLLESQDKINDQPNLNITEESDHFVTQAKESLTSIKKFNDEISILEFTRYTLRDIFWTSAPVDGGENWFILFKNVWRKRFNEKWSLWAMEQQRLTIKRKMISLLEATKLKGLEYRPWDDLWVSLVFKRELPVIFLKTFYTTLYTKVIARVLKKILSDGNFYRRENFAEYSESLRLFEHQERNIKQFEINLSPEGEIGKSFVYLKSTKGTNTKGKITIEILMKSLEGEARQILESTDKALASLIKILAGILGETQDPSYATLVNWNNISQDETGVFHTNVKNIYKQLEMTKVLLAEANTLETNQS